MVVGGTFTGAWVMVWVMVPSTEVRGRVPMLTECWAGGRPGSPAMPAVGADRVGRTGKGGTGGSAEGTRLRLVVAALAAEAPTDEEDSDELDDDIGGEVVGYAEMVTNEKYGNVVVVDDDEKKKVAE
jgi:hypothetical protein